MNQRSLEGPILNAKGGELLIAEIQATLARSERPLTSEPVSLSQEAQLEAKSLLGPGPLPALSS